MTEQQNSFGRGKSKRIVSGVVIGLLLAFILNPGAEKHRTAIDEEYRAKNPLSGALGAGKLVSSMVEYKNFYFFSTSGVGKDRISFGLLGKVFVSNLDIGNPLLDATDRGKR